MPAQADARPRILVSDALTEEGLQILSQNGDFEVVNDPEITPERLAEVLGEFDALVIRSRSRVTRPALEKSGRLRVIGRAGVGVDNVDVAAATERGVIVMNTPEGNTLSTAEHTVSMMVSLVRRIPQADATMKAGKWEKKALTGVELYGKTLGIMGLGKIGREVAHRMAAFGMKILGYDPFVTAPAAEKIGVELASVDDICRRADIITVHTPLTAETKGLINAARIELMKPSALLVNCARGGIIDETDLLAALKAGRIAGAALDVFIEEPLPKDHPFRLLSNIVLSPHLAASTTEAQEKVTRDVANQIVEVLRGGTVRNAVNYPSLDPKEMERLAPVLLLAEKMGRFVSQYCPAPVERVELLYSGRKAQYPLAPMTSAFLKGYLETQVKVGVNYVNAPYLAQMRGIEVIESRSTESYDYTGLMTAVVRSVGGVENTVSGTRFRGAEPHLVILNNKHLDVKLSGNLIVIQNRDVPGIVGNVGTLLGKAGINIADMTWGRHAPGSDATTVLNVDQDVSAAVIGDLRNLPNIVHAQHIVV